MCGLTFGNSQGKASGNRAGRIPESGMLDLGIPRQTGVSARKVLPERKNLPGEEEIAGAEDIAGGVALASVGINI